MFEIEFILGGMTCKFKVTTWTTFEDRSFGELIAYLENVVFSNLIKDFDELGFGGEMHVTINANKYTRSFSSINIHCCQIDEINSKLYKVFFDHSYEFVTLE